MMENQLKCFLSLAETKNFTTTANALFLSQQAVSKNIAKLEEELGLRLFYRTSRVVELTADGVECYQLFSKLWSQYSVGISAIRRNSETRMHSQQIGLQYFIDFTTTIKQVYVTLKAQNPDLQWELTRHSPTTLIERLNNHNLDLILIYRRFLPTQTDGFKMLHLADTPRFLMVAPDHPLVKSGACFADFIHEPVVFDSLRGESNEAFQARVHRDLKVLGLEPRDVIWVPDRDTAYTYAELGKGVVIGCEMSRMARARDLVSYPTGVFEDLMAVWNAKDDTPLIEQCAREFARVLKSDQQGTFE